MGGGGPSWDADEVARLIVKIDDVKQRSRRMTVTLDESCMEMLAWKLGFAATPQDLAHLVEGFLSTFVHFDSCPLSSPAYRLGVMYGSAYDDRPRPLVTSQPTTIRKLRDHFGVQP